MSQIYFKKLKKNLVCSLCGKDDEFKINTNISVTKESPFQYDSIPINMVSCSCGYTIFLSNVSFERDQSSKSEKINVK